MKKLLCICLLLTACMPENNKSKINYYYDLQDALQKLEKPKAVFQKTTIAEGKTETQILKNLDWQKELAFFEQANLNKSAFRGGYQEIKSLKQDTILIEYIAKNKEFKVKKLNIALLKDSSLVMAEAFINTDNYLYSSEKYLKLICKDQLIQSYYIKGKQKMIFTEPEYFEVKAEMIK